MELVPYRGDWSADDVDANFKREVAEYSRQDPVPTLERLSASTGIPVGAIARYVLVKWTAEGSEALLAIGPRTVSRMWATFEEAEAADSDDARLHAYESLRQMVSWLRVPLDEA